MDSHTAATAREHTYNQGVPDYSPAFEVEEYEAAGQEAEDRLEAEGRREMYATLFGDWLGAY